MGICECSVDRSAFLADAMPARSSFGFLSAIVLIATLSTAHAAPPESPPKPPAIAATCTACHGQKGVSPMAGSPSLAAQPDIFLQYQLVFMRDGARDAGVMKAVVKNLTDENIRDLGAYYSALPPPPPLKAPGQVDEPRVAALMQQRHCDSCHKADYAGQGESARLAGQRPEYLIKALSDYRAGTRRGRGLAAMMEVSVTLSDDDMKMIATYLARKP
jgi:cytochrome c553